MDGTAKNLSLSRAQVRQSFANRSPCTTTAITDGAVRWTRSSMLNNSAVVDERVINRRCTKGACILTTLIVAIFIVIIPINITDAAINTITTIIANKNITHSATTVPPISAAITVRGQTLHTVLCSARRANRRHVRATQCTHSIHLINNSAALERLKHASEGRKADYNLLEPTTHSPPNMSLVAKHALKW